MPYIAIKCFPKDEETKKAAVEKINEVMLEIWKCPPEALTISIEEVPREEWVETVKKPEIETKLDKMYILSGEKRF